MFEHEPDEEMPVPISQQHLALQELEQESLALQQRRRDLSDQCALLDVERAELEQQLSELKLKYALLDALSTQLNQREAMLVSEYEVIRMEGNRSSTRLLRRELQHADTDL